MTINNLDSTQFFSVPIPLYGNEVYVTYGSDLKFLEKSFKSQSKKWKKLRGRTLMKQIKEEFKRSNEAGATYNWHQKHKIHYICIHECRSALELVKYVSHETMHATFQILEYAGMELAGQSEEAYTYLQQYLLHCILERIDMEMPETPDEPEIDIIDVMTREALKTQKKDLRNRLVDYERQEKELEGKGIITPTRATSSGRLVEKLVFCPDSELIEKNPEKYIKTTDYGDEPQT